MTMPDQIRQLIALGYNLEIFPGMFNSYYMRVKYAGHKLGMGKQTYTVHVKYADPLNFEKGLDKLLNFIYKDNRYANID